MIFRNHRPLAGRLLSIVPAALALLAHGAIASAAPTHRPSFDTTRFVPESELRNGQVGYALTVFHGTTIERFGVRILGVLKKVNNGKDLILIKVTSGPSVTRHANIAHGMSGSPVYLGKRMVGAIAYGLPFAKEPIGLVTPIGDMLDAWDPDLPSKPNIAMQTGIFAASTSVPVSNSLLATSLGGLPLTGRAQDSTQFEALGTPLMISGMSPHTISALAPTFAPLGLVPMAGGGSVDDHPATASDEASLIPGAAVGVSIVQGDVDMTAIGTLTYRDGNRVIAFGHPFTGIGPIDAAMTTATIADLFPSVEDSTKLGAPITTVGRIFQDRPFSVGGVIGNMPHMIPVSVSIDDQSDKRSRVFKARVINHPLLTGKLILSVVDEAILETHGSPGDAVATVKMDVDAEQLGHVVRSNVFYDPLSIAEASTADLESLLQLFSANPFYPITVRSVTFDITIQSRHDTAQIDHIFVPKLHYQPGDKVEVGVVVKRYKQEPEVQNLTLTIPPSTPNGPVTLVVRGGTPTMLEAVGLRPVSAGAPATNIAQLVRKFLERPKNNEIVASLLLPTTAINVQGEKLSLLPPNFSSIMRAQHSTGLKLERDEVKLIKPMPWVLTGSQTLMLVVARKNPLDTPDDQNAAPQSQPQQPQQPTSSTGEVQTPEETITPSEQSMTWIKPTSEQAAPVPLPTTSQTAPAVAVNAAGVAAGDGDENDDDGDAPDAGPQAASGADKPMPVGRLAGTWRQDSADEFASGTLENVAITSGNELRLAASPQFFAPTTTSYIWSLTTDGKGGVYAGTGDDGTVYKSTAKGSATPFFHTNELEVTALAIDRQTGEIFAGTAPHGLVYRITPDGKGSKVFTADEKYITALAVDSAHAKLYIATGGGSGKVYSAPLSDISQAKVFWTSPSAHILAITVDSAGVVYASGAPEGVVYAITPAGKSSVFYTALVGQVVSTLAAGKGDLIYAGTAPRGMLVKFTPSATGGTPAKKALLPKFCAPIYAMTTAPDGTIWSVGGNTLYSVAPDDTVLTHTAETEVQFTSLTTDENGEVFAGTSDIGQIYRLADHDPAAMAIEGGLYTSSVHDTKYPSKWGTITWDANTPAATSVAIQTRTGDVPRPDDSWSDWSAVYTTPAGQQISSPPARYIQYRVRLSGRATEPAARASVTAVTIYYLTRNQAPNVKLTDPEGGDAIAGAYKVRWNAADPDHDTLSYDLYYSTDQKTWTPIKPEARQTVPHPAGPSNAPSAPVKTAPVGAKPTVPNPGKTGAVPIVPVVPVVPTAKATPLDTHVIAVTPPHPSGQMPPAIAAAMAAAAKQAGGGVQVSAQLQKATSQAWDTRKVADGRYWLKVVASDRPSNAVDSLSAESIVGPIVVDNAPPTVAIDGPAVLDDQKRATVTGIAQSKISYLAGVQYKIDDQPDWYSAAAVNGMFDSTREPFTLTTQSLAPGKHKITVEAINEADTSGQKVVDIEVGK